MDTDQAPGDGNLESAEQALTPESGERAASRFDPTPYMRQLRGRGGGGEYLDVKWRLLWLRREHPDAEIVTEHVRIEDSLAIFKATVTLPTGGKATGYGSETAGDFGDFIEKAETKAIGRALNALGYGAQFSEREDEAELAPPPRPATPARPRPAAPAAPIDFAANRGRGTTGAETGSDAESSARRGGPGPATPAEPQLRETESAVAPAARRRAGQAGAAEADAEMADYSWTAFWPWARSLGLNGPKPVETLIGRPTAGLTPAELRNLILQARGEA